MKSKMLFFVIALFAAVLVSCSDDEKTVKGDPDLTHEGVQWNIESAEYTLVDQNVSGGIGQTFKQGTKANAGTFYFVDGGEKGSFEMNIEGYNKEDAFAYTNSNGDVSIIAIDQQVGVQTNQNVIALTGSSTETEITLSGTITKQSTSGQFVLELEMVLKKK